MTSAVKGKLTCEMRLPLARVELELREAVQSAASVAAHHAHIRGRLGRMSAEVSGKLSNGMTSALALNTSYKWRLDHRILCSIVGNIYI